MEKYALILILLFPLTGFSKEPQCDNSNPIYAGQPGVVLCDFEGPNGSENFLMCIPAPTNGSGQNFYGPISLKSYLGYQVLNVTSSVDGGSSVTSAVKIVNEKTNEVEFASRYANNSVNAYIKNLGGKPFWFTCRPY